MYEQAKKCKHTPIYLSISVPQGILCRGCSCFRHSRLLALASLKVGHRVNEANSSLHLNSERVLTLLHNTSSNRQFCSRRLGVYAGGITQQGLPSKHTVHANQSFIISLTSNNEARAEINTTQVTLESLRRGSGVSRAALLGNRINSSCFPFQWFAISSVRTFFNIFKKCFCTCCISDSISNSHSWH